MKKIIAKILVLSIIASSFFVGNTKALAAENELANAEVVENKIKDVDKIKFTHKEWMGIQYEDLDGKTVNGEDVFGIEREEARLSIIPYQDEKTAADAVWNYNSREKSTYFNLLTGKDNKWDLTVVQNQEEANNFLTDDNNFTKTDFVKNEKDNWKAVDLPVSWTGLGFDFSIYTNVRMPWQSKYDKNVYAPKAPTNYNPVGLYRKTFKVDPLYTENGRRVYLSFQGVESAYYVYINGKEVGYSEDSFSPHAFDITDYLNPAGQENLLAVKVHKF